MVFRLLGLHIGCSSGSLQFLIEGILLGSNGRLNGTVHNRVKSLTRYDLMKLLNHSFNLYLTTAKHLILPPVLKDLLEVVDSLKSSPQCGNLEELENGIRITAHISHPSDHLKFLVKCPQILSLTILTNFQDPL
jgi:hypothetical protein